MSGVMELKKRCLPRLSVELLSKEHVVFSKMLQRAKNQHRHDLSYQKLTGVSRKIRKYLKMVNLQLKLKVIVKVIFGQSAMLDGTVQAVEELYHHLLESATFTAHLLLFTEDTWTEVNQRLVKALFVPFNTIMMASLSRIWVCLRCHLLGIAETYSTLQNTVPQARSPVSHVVAHLKENERGYLDTPALKHLHPPLPTANEHTPSVQQGGSYLQQNSHVATGHTDTGVVVSLTEKEMLERERDFKTCSNRERDTPQLTDPTESGLNLQSESPCITASGSPIAREKKLESVKTTAKERKKGRRKKLRFLLRRLRKRNPPLHGMLPEHRGKKKLSLVKPSSFSDCNDSDNKNEPQEDIASNSMVHIQLTNNPTPDKLSSNDKKKKKKQQKEKVRPKRLGKKGRFSCGFRKIVFRRSGVEVMILGKKAQAAKQTVKQRARERGEQSSAGVGHGVLEEGRSCVGGEFQHKTVDLTAGVSGAHAASDSRDDIDRIFSNLS